jgi:hypothetical protein
VGRLCPADVRDTIRRRGTAGLNEEVPSYGVRTRATIRVGKAHSSEEGVERVRITNGFPYRPLRTHVKEVSSGLHSNGIVTVSLGQHMDITRVRNPKYEARFVWVLKIHVYVSRCYNSIT